MSSKINFLHIMIEKNSLFILVDISQYIGHVKNKLTEECLSDIILHFLQIEFSLATRPLYI